MINHFENGRQKALVEICNNIPTDFNPNTPKSYVQAKKRPDGKYQLFYIGTRNEVFPGELFNSASEAKGFFEVQKVKRLGK